MENENTITEQQELETLRSQMDLLRKKLEQESIINEKLMRETMRSRVSTINRQGWISIAVAICMVLWFPLCFNTLSTAFIITTIVFMAVDAIATWIIHKQVDERQLMSEDMRTVFGCGRGKTCATDTERSGSPGCHVQIVFVYHHGDIVISNIAQVQVIVNSCIQLGNYYLQGVTIIDRSTFVSNSQ